jgi:hypothetical protein
MIPYRLLLLIPIDELGLAFSATPTPLGQAGPFAWEARNSFVPGFTANQAFVPGFVAGQGKASGQ